MSKRINKKIACIIPTYNDVENLSRLLDSLDVQSLACDLFVVDSSSTDGTIEMARQRTGEVHVIPSIDFNHGGTRQLMVDRHPGYDIYVFMTQDAYLTDPDAIEILVSPFQDPKVGAVCGRQLPHLNATVLASHARAFNYKSDVQVKSFEDVPRLGLRTAFMSNSFAAYRADALTAVGGFPSHVIFAEDMYVAARMLISGWKVVYAGTASCRHSHNYSVSEEFSRYFDMGVFHAREPWIRRTFGGAGGEGLRYVRSELAFLGLRRWYMWPEALWRNLIKLGAYKLGLKEAVLPLALKRRLGMYKRYWDGPFAALTLDDEKSKS